MNGFDNNKNMEISNRLESLLKRHFPGVEDNEVPVEPAAPSRDITDEQVVGKARSNAAIAVELLVENHDPLHQINRFLRNLDEMIHEMSDMFGGIVGSYPLWKDKTVVTVMVELSKMGQFVFLLACMPEVENIEEGITFSRRIEFPVGSVGISPYPLNSITRNKFRVVMKKPSNTGY